MKMFVFQGKSSNFGDDLNHWLWSRLLPNFFDKDDNTIFLGIGSIIYDNHPPLAKKIVFGAGYAGYTRLPKIDETWEFRFVRGKQTAKAVGLPEALAIGDAGILIRLTDLPNYEKRHDVSFMPHFESAENGSWEVICQKLGINFIDPRWDVDRVLENMLSSRLMISEAMHGIIIADALRIPWRAVRPLDPNHHAKWADWASVLDLDVVFSNVGPSNILEWTMTKFWKTRRVIYWLRKQRQRLFLLGGKTVLPSTVRQLRDLANSPGQLSRDENIQKVTEEMREKLEELKRDYGNVSQKRS